MPSVRSVLRSLLVPAVRPVWRKVWVRIAARIDARTAEIEPLVTRVASLETTWRQHVPAFLNAVGTVPALSHELARLGAGMEQTIARLSSTGASIDSLRERTDSAHESIRILGERVEFVRREVLFEMAHSRHRKADPDSALKNLPRVLSPAKILAGLANNSLRLNLGCGHIALPDYVNVDRRELPGVDVVAEADCLPIEPGTVQEIFSAHLVEHFPQEAMRRRLLPYWRDLLRPGGLFRAVAPDGAAMLAEAANGTCAFDDFREVVFGAQDYEGDFHYNLFTPDSLRRLLEEVGFTDIHVPVLGRRNGKCFEFEVNARRA